MIQKWRFGFFCITKGFFGLITGVSWVCFSFKTIVIIKQQSNHVGNLRVLCTSIESIVNSNGTRYGVAVNSQKLLKTTPMNCLDHHNGGVILHFGLQAFSILAIVCRNQNSNPYFSVNLKPISI